MLQYKTTILANIFFYATEWQFSVTLLWSQCPMSGLVCSLSRHMMVINQPPHSRCSQPTRWAHITAQVCAAALLQQLTPQKTTRQVADGADGANVVFTDTAMCTITMFWAVGYIQSSRGYTVCLFVVNFVWTHTILELLTLELDQSFCTCESM